MKKRRNTPKYKKLYLDLINSTTETTDILNVNTTLPTTHRITDYHITEYVYDINTQREEDAQEFEGEDTDKIQIVKIEKKTYFDRQEIRKLNEHER